MTRAAGWRALAGRNAVLVRQSTREACVDPALRWIEVDRVRVKG